MATACRRPRSYHEARSGLGRGSGAGHVRPALAVLTRNITVSTPYIRLPGTLSLTERRLGDFAAPPEG